MTLTSNVRSTQGSVIAAQVLNDKTVYNQLEDVYGRMTTVTAGDIIVGALGNRNALHGYEGRVPERLTAGDQIQLLNLGGVMGRCVSFNHKVGPPFELKVLGQVLTFPEFGSRRGQAANISDGAVTDGSLAPKVPVVYVMGTCMNAGKTAAASALIKRLRELGLEVAGAKLTGVSLMRDALAMRDRGARWVTDFTDAGAVSTDKSNAVLISKRIFSHLASHGPDVIVAETGDGIMGEYGVQSILADAQLRGLGKAFVFCANDPVGVAGGVNELRVQYGIDVDVISGPATDNEVGLRFVTQHTGIAALNALASPSQLADIVYKKLQA